MSWRAQGAHGLNDDPVRVSTLARPLLVGKMMSPGGLNGLFSLSDIHMLCPYFLFAASGWNSVHITLQRRSTGVKHVQQQVLDPNQSPNWVKIHPDVSHPFQSCYIPPFLLYMSWFYLFIYLLISFGDLNKGPSDEVLLGFYSSGIIQFYSCIWGGAIVCYKLHSEN